MEATLSHQETSPGLPTALDIVVELVDLVGAEKVAGGVVHADNIHVQPSDLARRGGTGLQHADCADRQWCADG